MWYIFPLTLIEPSSWLSVKVSNMKLFLLISIHSRWLKFLLIIWRQVFPISFLDRSTLVILFIPKSTSISYAHSYPKPFLLKLIILTHLISTILLRNYLNEFLLNPWIMVDLRWFWSWKGRLILSCGIYWLGRRRWVEVWSSWVERGDSAYQLRWGN